MGAALIFLMQVGFLCLETGLTHSKNNSNAAMKNEDERARKLYQESLSISRKLGDQWGIAGLGSQSQTGADSEDEA
ncbi:MAG TPA: hypothetical protein PLD47_02210 [Aggregatilineales bacterium]|nr:hypothetical protein [Aggregatilineales bacterium]